MPLYQLLTDRTLAEASAITPTTLIHIVTTADTRQNSAGSSYKAELGQLVGLFNFTGGTVSGATNFTNGLTANTFSASSIFVNGVQITGDTFVTGATYSAGTAIFTNNQGNQFNLTGLTEPFSGGSGNCITDLYVSNIHSCSPLNINPLDEGNVYFGSTSGVTIDVTNSRLGIGTTTPQYRLESYGSAGNFSVSLDNSTDNFTSISGGTNDFTYLEARTPNTNVVRVGVRPTGDTLNGAYGKQGDGFLFGSITNNGLNIISTPGTGTEDYIRFYAGQNALPANTPDIHIQGTGTTRGYVGLGTTTPTENLHIVSTSSARIRIEADTDDITETDNAEILFTQDGGNTKANISLTPDTNNDLMIGVNAGAGTTPDIRFNTRSDGTSFTTSADTKVIIKNDGKVGIGINEPQYFLQVFSGSSQLYYDPTTAGGQLAISGSTNLPRFGIVVPPYLSKPAAGVTIGMRAWDDTLFPGYGKVGDSFFRAGNESNGLNIINTPGAGNEDYIRFYAGQEGLTANTPDIHIQGSGTTRGFVGIKTSNPTANLHVSGNTLVSGNISANTLVLSGVTVNPKQLVALFFGHDSLNPGDTQTYFIGNSINLTAPISGSDGRRVIMPKTGNIIRIGICQTVGGTLGTSETSTFTVNNVTQSTQSTITTGYTYDASSANISYDLTSPLAVTIGDKVELRWTTPTWVTNPTAVRHQMNVYIEY